MTDIPEKLVKEVIEQARCIIAEDGGPMERGRACYLIRRVGKAYADGEMPLPGEVDRWKGGKMMVRPYFSLSHAVKGLELIALRKEGTGKEEKETRR